MNNGERIKKKKCHFPGFFPATFLCIRAKKKRLGRKAVSMPFSLSCFTQKEVYFPGFSGKRSRKAE